VDIFLDRNTDSLDTLQPLGRKDIMVGMPSLNNEDTIRGVTESVAGGLLRYFPGKRCVIMLSNGYSTDTTREAFQSISLTGNIDRVTSTYTGISGKGVAIRNILEAAGYLGVKALMLIDSDIRSATAEWVNTMIEPILKDETDFMFPLYYRHKYDDTITSVFIYPLIRALYGLEIRQPIGGEISMCGEFVQQLLKENVWNSSVARYGIDVWIALRAIISDLRISQGMLGVKIHETRAPSTIFNLKFKQIIGTCFDIAGKYADAWIDVKKVRDIPLYGEISEREPEPVEANFELLTGKFMEHFSEQLEVWQKVLPRERLEFLANIRQSLKEQRLYISDDDWAKLTYDFMIAYNRHEVSHEELLESLIPLYFIRIADLMNKTFDSTNQQSIRLINQQAEAFLSQKNYLVNKWKKQFVLAGV
jgi:glucosylglycerate synthase